MAKIELRGGADSAIPTQAAIEELRARIDLFSGGATNLARIEHLKNWMEQGASFISGVSGMAGKTPEAQAEKRRKDAQDFRASMYAAESARRAALNAAIEEFEKDFDDNYAAYKRGAVTQDRFTAITIDDYRRTLSHAKTKDDVDRAHHRAQIKVQTTVDNPQLRTAILDGLQDATAQRWAEIEILKATNTESYKARKENNLELASATLGKIDTLSGETFKEMTAGLPESAVITSGESPPDIATLQNDLNALLDDYVAYFKEEMPPDSFEGIEPGSGDEINIIGAYLEAEQKAILDDMNEVKADIESVKKDIKAELEKLEARQKFSGDFMLDQSNYTGLRTLLAEQEALLEENEALFQEIQASIDLQNDILNLQAEAADLERIAELDQAVQSQQADFMKKLTGIPGTGMEFVENAIAALPDQLVLDARQLAKLRNENPNQFFTDIKAQFTTTDMTPEQKAQAEQAISLLKTRIETIEAQNTPEPENIPVTVTPPNPEDVFVSEEPAPDPRADEIMAYAETERVAKNQTIYSMAAAQIERNHPINPETGDNWTARELYDLQMQFRLEALALGLDPHDKDINGLLENDVENFINTRSKTYPDWPEDAYHDHVSYDRPDNYEDRLQAVITHETPNFLILSDEGLPILKDGDTLYAVHEDRTREEITDDLEIARIGAESWDGKMFQNDAAELGQSLLRAQEHPALATNADHRVGQFKPGDVTAQFDGVKGEVYTAPDHTKAPTGPEEEADISTPADRMPPPSGAAGIGVTPFS